MSHHQQQQEQQQSPTPAGEQDYGTLQPDSTAAAAREQRPSIYRRFKAAAKALKREVLALYYAMQDPRTGVLPRLLGMFVLAYALSPFDLIPDFIPILGLVDDLLLLPGMIWLALHLIPPQVREDSRRRAAEQPLTLSKNWGAAVTILALWDTLLCWLLWLGCSAWGPPGLRQWRWWAVGGCAAVLVLVEAAWVWWQLGRERSKAVVVRSSRSDEDEGALEEGLLGRDDGSGAEGQA